MKKKVIVQIPCLNEETTIHKVIRDFKKKLPGAKVFVYDNDSTDKSVEISKKNGAEVRIEKRRGKGNVVRRMFSDRIDANFYIMIDGDDTYDISNVRTMLKKMEKQDYDMLVAKRIHTKSSAYRKGHLLGNKLFSKFVKLIFGKGIDDIFSGFRIFSKRFVKTFPQNSSEFEIEAELTIHALEQNLRIDEFECDYKERPHGSFSKLNTYKDGIKILKLILILVKDEKPLFFFSILSIFLIGLSFYIGVPIIHDFYNTGLVEKLPSAILSGLIMVIAFLCFFCGLVLDVIKKMRNENKRMNYLALKD